MPTYRLSYLLWLGLFITIQHLSADLKRKTVSIKTYNIKLTKYVLPRAILILITGGHLEKGLEDTLLISWSVCYAQVVLM